MMDMPRIALAVVVLAAPGALAQPELPEGPPPGAEVLPDPVIPSPPPAQPEPGEQPSEAMELDALFAALSVADAQSAKSLQRKIMSEWARSESDADTLLLSRATKAREREDYEGALLFLDDLTRLSPDFAEAWNRRATVHFLREDYGRAVADIARVLAIEPRHFGALSGLGIILDRLERDADALAAFRRALEIHPHLEGAAEAVERLTPIVEGQEL